ncbi:MAG: lipopolysaccharide heptosyltransferase II [Candidatus Omnitrophica bacterium]|jgi:heptosyltransferase-1|nr:lipopolysaccharide heptosyltransferase II [Candidatus Omnitrophota bacterium]
MSIKTILIFNPFGIGDVLFSTPLIRNLKRRLPEVAISYICSQRAYPLLKNNTFLDEVLIFEKDQWRSIAAASKIKFVKELISFWRKIKKKQFDVIFDLSLNSQYGFFFKTIGIKKRIGFNYKNRGRFLTHKIDVFQGYCDKHVARYYLELLKFLNITPQDYPFDIFIPTNSFNYREYFLNKYNLSSDSLLIGVCPGSGDSWQETAYFKRWPKEYFLEICLRLALKPKVKVILLGSKSEQPICDYIQANTKGKLLNLCGKLNLEELCNIISLCKLIITNDGGPFHIAQALRKKAVVFYGPVDEKVYGAYPDIAANVVFSGKTACRPCYKKFRFQGCQFDKLCLRQIEPVTVFSQIEKAIFG